MDTRLMKNLHCRDMGKKFGVRFMCCHFNSVFENQLQFHPKGKIYIWFQIKTQSARQGHKMRLNSLYNQCVSK